MLRQQRIWAVEWQEIADYVLPRKNSIITERLQGSKRTQRLFDSTALDARHKLASAMHGALTSSYVRWFYLETDDDYLNRDQQTGIWLDQVGDAMLRHLNRSNFAAEAGEFYTDLVTFASACMYMEEIAAKYAGSFEGFRFRAEQPGRFAWSEGADGMVNVVLREIFMSAEAVLEKWPDTPEYLVSRNNRSPDELLSVIHSVEPDQQRFRSTYVLTNQRYKLSQGQFEENPYLCARWAKASGEIYGRGPTHDALPDIRSLNKIIELQLRALPKLIDPPLLAAFGDVIGPARLTPGGVTNVRSANPRESVVPIQTGIDLRQVGVSVERLEAKIRSIYHETELQLPNGPQMTAEEVRARRELMLMLLGPTVYGHIESEFLRPLIDRGFAMMRRAGVLPPLPPALAEAAQRSRVLLRVRYDGPIARAQRASDVDAMVRLQQFVMPMAQLAPESLDVIDSDEMVRTAGQKFGVPPQVIRDPNQVDQVRQAKQQQEQAAAQAAALQQAATASKEGAPMVKALGKAPEPGSPMAGQ